MPIKILVLIGATASGKTALALEWAGRFGGEIINADSRQIYRYMDIGTAKPTLQQQALIPHHLVDIATPDQSYTLAEFQEAAYRTIAEIHARGKLPMLVGGTGLYITATLEGWRMPEVAPNPTLRTLLESLSKRELLERLQALDPLAAATIDVDNPRRLVRAIEVCMETGRPFSEMRQKQSPGYDALCFALSLPREEIYARADGRLEQMLAAGWLEEVRHLTEDLGYSPRLPAMSALGYPQMAAHLRGELSLADALHEVKFATHRFIRRQETWLRGHDPGWLAPDEGKIEAWLSL